MSGSVFLSYAHADKPLARRLARSLQDYGLRVWIDEGELRVGDSIIERIAAALDDIDYVVALVSRHSVDSGWCRKELSLAMTDEVGRSTVRVLPIRVGDVRMPPALLDKAFLTVDETSIYVTTRQLVTDIRRHVENPAGTGVTDPMGAIGLRVTQVSAGPSPAQALLRQSWAYVKNDSNLGACLIDWLKAYSSAADLAGCSNEILFWLHSLAAYSAGRLPDAHPAHLARFGGLADTVRTFSDPVQTQMADIVGRLYDGGSG